MHLNNLKFKQSSTMIDEIYKPVGISVNEKVERSKKTFVTLLAQNNVPMAFADAFNHSVTDMFPDSEIAKKFKCGRTTATALLFDIDQSSKDHLVNNITGNTMCYSLSTDGGSKYLSKLYPVLIYSYDSKTETVGWKILDIHEIDGRVTGHNVFQLLNKSVESSNLVWQDMLVLGADNTSTMSGDKEGVYGHVFRVNENCHFSGCICHLLDIAAKKASKKLACDVDELIVSIDHYLEHSDVKKLQYEIIQQIHGADVKAAVKHVTSRGLSLHTVLPNYLTHWTPLRAFFQGRARYCPGRGKET